MFRPNAQRFTTPIGIQHRIVTDVNGALDISYSETPTLDFCEWKGYGGTDSIQSGTLTVINTAILTMWYRPDVTEKDRILLNNDNNLPYEVINTENVGMQNQFLILKVSRCNTA